VDRGQSGEYAGEAEFGGELRGASCMEIVGAEGGEFQVGFGFPGSCAQPAVHGERFVEPVVGLLDLKRPGCGGSSRTHTIPSTESRRPKSGHAPGHMRRNPRGRPMAVEAVRRSNDAQEDGVAEGNTSACSHPCALAGPGTVC
jgi:hypothetical protein